MINKNRLDQELASRGLVSTRSQAESYIKLGKVKLNGRVITKAGHLASADDKIELSQAEQYVSRAGLKLASVSQVLGLDFNGKVVLDVGSSTGGFTDYALKHGAKKVIAVDVGSNQLHPNLRTHPNVELHEKTDIRNFKTKESIDIVLVDVSFISLRQVLPAVAKLSQAYTQIVAMLKPQFEAGTKDINKGIIKNDTIRRQILKDFELWTKQHFIIQSKADSQVAGSKGNTERFYLLRKLS
ncbi:TlyA family RNA methyltransferase [Candidatus Saccharibacteria bacterium]|nr:TlyA family RNA methyltransferase [Candidatus Saccharibacteria bacterium]